MASGDCLPTAVAAKPGLSSGPGVSVRASAQEVVGRQGRQPPEGGGQRCASPRRSRRAALASPGDRSTGSCAPPVSWPRAGPACPLRSAGPGQGQCTPSGQLAPGRASVPPGQLAPGRASVPPGQLTPGRASGRFPGLGDWLGSTLSGGMNSGRPFRSSRTCQRSGGGPDHIRGGSTRLWWCGQSSTRLSKAVAPPSHQGLMWWASQWASGLRQSVKAQPPSRNDNARRIAGVTSRWARPMSSTSDRLPSTAGTSSASQHNLRRSRALMGSPVSSLPTASARWRKSDSCITTTTRGRSPATAGACRTP